MTIEELDGVKPTNGQAWTRLIARCEAELKASGWKSGAVHPNSERWLSPQGQWYPGVFYAWLVMRAAKEQAC